MQRATNGRSPRVTQSRREAKRRRLYGTIVPPGRSRSNKRTCKAFG